MAAHIEVIRYFRSIGWPLILDKSIGKWGFVSRTVVFLRFHTASARSGRSDLPLQSSRCSGTEIGRVRFLSILLILYAHTVQSRRASLQAILRWPVVPC